MFKQALALEPNSVGAHLNLGTALREKGDLEGALEHLRRVADAEPTHASVQYEIGQTLGQSGNVAGALAAFERALELDPEMREGYYALGGALKQQGAAAAARRQAASPSPADDSYRAAQDAFGQGDLRAARAPGSKPRCASTTHTRTRITCSASCWGSREIFPRPVGHLQRAIALRPDSPEAHYNLGVALWYSGEKDRGDGGTAGRA